MKHLNLFVFAFTLLYSQFATAQDVSRAEFEALLKRVQMLEQQLKQTDSVSVDAIAAEIATRNTAVAETKVEKSGIIDRVISVMQSREENFSYPWMDAQKWAQIKKGMPVDSVLQILGEPNLNEPSLHKRIDYVFTYEGRRVATKKRVEGKVRFYKDRVANIEIPEL